MLPISRDAALYSAYLAVMSFYLDNIPGGLKPEEFDESQPLIGGKYKTLQIFFDKMCNTTSARLSDKYSCDLYLDNDWRTDRINARDSIETFIVKLADQLLAAPPRGTGAVALNWVGRGTV